MENSRWEDPRIRSLSGIVFLAGVWLIISAYIFNYTSTAFIWNQVVGGIVIAVLALVRYAFRSAVWASWLNALVSAWLIIATLTMSQTTAALWSGLVGSVVAFVLALANTTRPAETTHHLHHGHPAT